MESLIKVVSADELFAADGVWTPGATDTGGMVGKPDLLHIS